MDAFRARVDHTVDQEVNECGVVQTYYPANSLKVNEVGMG